MKALRKKSEYDKKEVAKFMPSILLGLLILGIIIGFFYLGRGLPVNPDSVVIENVELVDYDKTGYSSAADKKLVIEGTHKNDLFGFLVARQRIEDNILYLELEYTLNSKLNPYHDGLSPKFRHESTATDINSVDEIYVVGISNRNPKLIFTR